MPPVRPGRPRTAFASLLALLGACSGSCGGAPPLPESDRTAIPVRVTVVNDTDDTVYLHSESHCGFGPLTIEQGGEALDVYPGQSTFCAAAKQPRCSVAGSCAGAGLRPLAAGARWTVTWDGAHYVDARIDEGEAGEGCPTSCVVSLPAEDGPVRIKARAHSTCDAEGCDCELPHDRSACHPQGGLPPDPDLQAEATVTVPERPNGPLEAELRFGAGG